MDAGSEVCHHAPASPALPPMNASSFSIRFALTLVLVSFVFACGTARGQGEAARVLIVVGPSSHPPGSHEVAAGGRLMKQCLESMANVPGVKADVFDGWPKDD